MRRLSSRRVILDILVTHVAARHARKVARTAIRKRLDWEGRAASFPSLIGRCHHPLLVLQQTQFRTPYLLLVRFEVPTNS